MRRSSLILVLAALLGLPLSAAPASAQGGQISQEAQVFLTAFQVVRDYGLIPLGDSAVWNKAIDGLVSELDDPYAEVFTPAEYSEFQEDNTGNYAGIGVQITQLNEVITVTAVFRDTPAERAGLMVGDVILEVEGESTEGWSTQETSEVIRGPVGAPVTISLGRSGLTRAMSVTLERDSVHVSAVAANRLDEKVGYISLDRVANDSGREIEEAVTTLGPAGGLILDLRGNPGGLLNEAITISDLFLEPGKRVVSIAARSPGADSVTVQEEFFTESPTAAGNRPVVILVDGFSASASEIIAGALQDYDRALILGTRTFGKGVVQNIFRLTPTRHMRITTGEWFTPLDRSLHRPRSATGRLLNPDPEEFETVTTAGGRTVTAGGGVFPDLEIRPDTLTLRERDFLSQLAAENVPLALRIEEFAFQQAEERRRSGDDPYLDSDAFDGFVEALQGEGLAPEFVEDEEIREYLTWRVNVRMTDRAERRDLMLQWRRQRDPVLDRAIRLLQSVENQQELFEAAGRLADERATEAEAA